MEDMKIQSKFNENDKVWFYYYSENKFYEGTVKAVSSWDRYSGFRYDVEHNGDLRQFTESIEEKNLYASKQEIIDTAFVSESAVPQQES